MKFNIEVDCTPEEARHFFGLPDVKPMQDAVMARMEKQMLEALSATTPEALFKAWMPLSPWNPAQAQEMMANMMRAPFGNMGGGSGGPGGGKREK